MVSFIKPIEQKFPLINSRAVFHLSISRRERAPYDKRVQGQHYKMSVKCCDIITPRITTSFMLEPTWVNFSSNRWYPTPATLHPGLHMNSETDVFCIYDFLYLLCQAVVIVYIYSGTSWIEREKAGKACYEQPTCRRHGAYSLYFCDVGSGPTVGFPREQYPL